MDYPVAQENYNAAGKPYREVNLLWITTADDGEFGFSDRRYTEVLTVRSVIDRTDVTRTYMGGAHIMNLPEIIRTQALTSQQHRLVLSPTNEVRNMVFGANMTRAVLEWHKGQIDANTGLIIARPVCELYALVDDVSDNITELGPNRSAEWAVTLTVIPHHAEMEYANPAMRTYEEGLKRDGDEIFLYADSVGDWEIPWGKKVHKHSDRKSGHKGGGDGGDDAHSSDLGDWGRE